MTQTEALDLLKLGHNIFLTGAAGSGKTYLLNRYVSYLRERGVGVAVTASTGIAATHIGGVTIHSWSGLGIRDTLADDEIERLMTNSRIKRNFKHAKVLVIDEVSMLHAHQLENIERIARHMLDFTKSFGGLQVVLCGDFFQLPPVSREWEAERTFAYECPAWESGAFQVCYLTEQFRQAAGEGDAPEDPLLTILNGIRKGSAGENAKTLLRSRYNKTPIGASDTALRPTRLFARNVNVDAINMRELDALSGERKTFRMETRGFRALVDSLKKNCLAMEELVLKTGAEVMFIRNAADGRYVNGTRGTVVSFEKASGLPVIKTFDGRMIVAEPEEWHFEENGAVRASLTQVPLRLAWAVTIHKSQGMTLDAAEMDLSDAFEPGMGYVALSRVRSLSGLKLTGLNDTALSVHPKILRHDAHFRAWSEAVEETLRQFSEEEKTRRHDEVLRERFGGSREPIPGAKETGGKYGKMEKPKKIPAHKETLALIEKGMPLAAIAEERGVTVGTIVGHLEKLKGEGELPDIAYLKPASFDAIAPAFEASKTGALTPVFKKLNGKYPFDTLRLVRLFLS